MSSDYGFWSASVDELKAGYTYNPVREEFMCLICERTFQKGMIFPGENGVLYEAERAVRQHILDHHGSTADYLLNMNKKYTGLSDVQKELLNGFKAGLSDKELAEKLDVTPSTIRTHRFKLKEKEKQAKVFLAIMEQLKDGKPADDLINIHKGATMVDERYAITNEEKHRVLRTYFKEGLDGPLQQFPSKEKRKIIVLQHIIRKFEPNKVYNEKEVNTILKDIHDDFVTIRRYLIEYGFMNRSKDCSEYTVKG